MSDIPQIKPTRDKTNLKTGTVRTAFMHTFKPVPNQKGVLKYSCVALFDKGKFKKKEDHPVYKMLLAAGEEALKSKDWPAPVKKAALKYLADLFKDGNKCITATGKPYEGYPGCYALKASESENYPPDLVNGLKEPADSSLQYSGSHWHFRFQVYGFDARKAGGKMALTCALKTGQFLGHGKRFGGGTSADEDYDAREDAYDEDAGEEEEE